jgi:hypothetical protein
MEQEAKPALNFPATFCCNCGSTGCESQVQETRVSRYFGIGRTGTTFHLQVPICNACRRTMRRRPPSFFGTLLVVGLIMGGCFLALLLLASAVTLPVWIGIHMLSISSVLGLVLTLVFYRLRRARPPKTTFYQPVRIKVARVHFADLMHGAGNVAFMKLAFTNQEYLNIFRDANRDAIAAGRLAVVRA